LKASKELAKGASEYAMQVKGLEIPAWSPSAFKGMGLVYAIGDRGGDHLQAPMMRIEQKSWVLPGIGPVVMDRSASESKGDVATVVQDVKAVIDSLVVCLLPSELDLEEYSLMLSATLGTEIQPTDLLKIGERVINLSRLFNIREGISRKDDVLPRRFYQLGKGEEEDQAFDAMVDQYYRARGWDKEGRPTMRKLVDLHLVEEYRRINYMKAT
jgi:aldehyde:ferredoxin oxidoreductase